MVGPPHERNLRLPSLRTLVASGALVALGATAPAHAAVLKVDASDRCLDNNKSYRLWGSGFTPRATVSLSGSPFLLEAHTDINGQFRTAFITPNETSFTPRTIVLGAVEPNNPAVSATTTIHVVRFGSNVPVFGDPSEVVTWRFAGFPNRTIYGHFRYRGKTMRDYRFGKARGICGTLVARARRLPAEFRSGKWTLQIDGRSRFSTKARPAYKGSFVLD